jgi:hypothetical protein
MGDTATIAHDVAVFLLDNTESLNGLTLENGAALLTFSHTLLVDGGSNATTNVLGAQLFVNEIGGFLGFDFVTDFLSVRQNGELRMQGGNAIANNGMIISMSSRVSGHGTAAAIGNTGFQLQGTIQPDGGELIIDQRFASLDLDGNTGGEDFDTVLDVTLDGDLTIQGTLSDPYSGFINIGNSNSVEFDTALDMEGEVNFTSGSGNRLIAPSIVFYSGVEVNVDGAVGIIDASTIWTGNTQISLVNPTDELHFADDSNFAFSTVFSNTGLLVNESGATMTLQDGADVSTRLLNHGTLDVGSSSAGFALLEEYEQSSSGRLKIGLGGPLPGVDFDQISITEDAGLSGMLDVSLLGNYTLSPGDSFEIVNIDGTLTAHFNNLGEGSSVDIFDDVELFITYFGGDGNDIVLYTALPGDFDLDGDVDGFDFLKWQRGESPDPLSQADLDEWQAAFGNPSVVAASAIVPEPMTGLMLVLGMVIMLTSGRNVVSKLNSA